MSDADAPPALKAAPSSPTLAQFYTSEYSIMMSRITGWVPLQYATWPILIAALTLIARMDNIDVSWRWWAALGTTLVVFVAYQTTMANMLYYVLLVEQYLRPRAQELVTPKDEFWIHERVFHRIYKQSVAWSPIWPPAICLSALVLVTGYLLAKYGMSGGQWACAIVALGLGLMAVQLAWQCAKRKREIAEVCRRSAPIEPKA